MTTYENVTHCIFDMDGLLINTEDLYTVATEQVMARYTDKKYTFEIKTKLMGRKPSEAIPILLQEMNVEKILTPEKYNEEVKKEYEIVFPTARLLPGVEKLINHLKNKNIPIGISTGSSNEAFDMKTKNLSDFFSKFDFIVKCGSDPDVKLGKPAADAFEVARTRFSPAPKSSKCLAFEDATNGVKSALAAGMQVVMVPDSRMSPEGKLGATLVLDSLEDFKPELFGLPPF